MRVLIVGSGGREHALAWKIAQSPEVKEVLSLPGNPGTARYGRRLPGSGEDPGTVVQAARSAGVDLVVIGPEAPLVAGVAEEVSRAGILVFGPTAAAAQLEGSKVFAKRLMAGAGVPTARFEVFEDAARAQAYLSSLSAPPVVKADGLAAGKGAIVCESLDEARQAVQFILADAGLGEAGRRIVIEERLEGKEASFLALCDGRDVLPLEPAQDHKRAYDQDRGPNTGGMGAYSPTPVVTPEIRRQAIERVLRPTLSAMAEEGIPFKGVLYAGLMITDEGPMVLEFNVRFGDPETQAILPRMRSDIVPLLVACAEGRLSGREAHWSDDSALCAVLASGGYPGPYEKGIEIRGLSEAEAVPNVVIFQAGTELRDGKCVTHGGRVLGITGTGETLQAAKEAAYEAVDRVSWKGCFCRRDIGWQAL